MAQFQAPPEAAAIDGQAHPPPESEGVAVVQQAQSSKIPRNAPCPCGSGKKYKQCHGRPGAAAL
ncbi:MAG: SEC-C metal-binding domain-containing protein [Actinomycetota bacterium]|nr:SEC-C metal-binding domain-containing protein [Actinomycetota bacterium]